MLGERKPIEENRFCFEDRMTIPPEERKKAFQTFKTRRAWEREGDKKEAEEMGHRMRGILLKRISWGFMSQWENPMTGEAFGGGQFDALTYLGGRWEHKLLCGVAGFEAIVRGRVE